MTSPLQLEATGFAGSPALAMPARQGKRPACLTDSDALTIECWDQAPGVPVLREASGLAECGRGLAITDDLTGGLGLPARDRPGRQVRLGRDPPARECPPASFWPCPGNGRNFAKRGITVCMN
jgi:hypothetical protein